MNHCREILLIIPLTAVLLLLVGATGSAVSKRAVCADNLRRIYQAAQSYSAGNDGMIVPGYVSRGAGRRTYWAEMLLPCVSNVSDFYCPADPSGRKGLTSNDLLPVMFDNRYVSYGINYHISSSGKPASAAAPYNINMVGDPSYVVYFGDARALQLRATRSCWTADWNPVHEKQGANYVMADGHAEFFTGHNPGLYDAIPGWKKDRKRWKNWR